MQLRNFRIGSGPETPVSWAGSQASIYSLDVFSTAAAKGEAFITLLVRQSGPLRTYMTPHTHTHTEESLHDFICITFVPRHLASRPPRLTLLAVHGLAALTIHSLSVTLSPAHAHAYCTLHCTAMFRVLCAAAAERRVL